MGQYRYDDIRGLIAKAEQNGPMMMCTFRCTISGQSIDSAVQIKEQGTMQRVQDTAKRSIWYGIRRNILYKVRRMLGYGFFGRIVADLGGEMLDSAHRMSENVYSEEQLNAATLRAFEAIAANFKWDQGMGQFVWAHPVS